MLAALGVIVTAIVVVLRTRRESNRSREDVTDPRVEPLRRLALERCASGEWTPCVEGLDEARRLIRPATRPEIQQAREPPTRREGAASAGALERAAEPGAIEQAGTEPVAD